MVYSWYIEDDFRPRTLSQYYRYELYISVDESLNGEVFMGNYYEEFAAPYALRNAGRFNPLVINAKGFDRIDLDILDDIRDHFAALNGIDTSAVTIEANHGEVSLRGEVVSRRVARFLTDVSRNVLGVRDVSNDLIVSDERSAAST